MPTLAPVFVLASFLLAGAPAGHAAGPADAREDGGRSPLAVQVEEGLLSVDVHDTPLGEVLEAIAEQAALTIEVHGGGGTRVTESFAGVRLDEGLRRLTRGHDVILIYGGTPRDANEARLVEAHVWEASAPAGRLALDPSERAARLKAIREMMWFARQRQPDALASLAGMLSDPDPAVRASAAAALGSLGGPEAAAALTGALGDQDASVRMSALSALGRRREESAVGSMAQVLARDQDARVRRAAVWALATLKAEEAYRAIEAAASDPDASVRGAATGALRAWERRRTPGN
jgi:hypothetical protein